MRSALLKITDNFWAKVQTVLLMVAIILPFLLGKLDISIVLNGEFDRFTINATNLGLPIWIIQILTGCILSGILCQFFRQENKEVEFNCGHMYKSSQFWWYRFCSAVLGYRKCNLKGVPLPVIARLVVNDTFPQYDCGVINEKNDKKINVESQWYGGNKPTESTKEINLIIMDTYEIEGRALNNIVGNSEIPSLILSREDKGMEGRWYVPEFATSIWKELNVEEKQKRRKIEKVNLYATLNPRNMIDIIEKVFRTYGRGKIRTLVVYTQDSEGDRMFQSEGIIIKM